MRPAAAQMNVSQIMDEPVPSDRLLPLEAWSLLAVDLLQVF